MYRFFLNFLLVIISLTLSPAFLRAQEIFPGPELPFPFPGEAETIYVEDFLFTVQLENFYDLVELGFDLEEEGEDGKVFAAQDEVFPLQIRLKYRRKKNVSEDELIQVLSSRKSPVVIRGGVYLSVRDGHFCFLSKRDYLIQRCSLTPTLDEVYTIHDGVEVMSWEGLPTVENIKGSLWDMGMPDQNGLFERAQFQFRAKHSEGEELYLEDEFQISARIYLNIVDTDDRGFLDFRNASPKVELRQWENQKRPSDILEFDVGDRSFQSGISEDERKTFLEDLEFKEVVVEVRKGNIRIFQDGNLVKMVAISDLHGLFMGASITVNADDFQRKFTPEQIKLLFPKFRRFIPKNEI